MKHTVTLIVTVLVVVATLTIVAAPCVAAPSVTYTGGTVAIATPVFPEAAAFAYQPRLFPGSEVVAVMSAGDDPVRVLIPGHALWVHKEEASELDKFELITSYSVAGICVDNLGGGAIALWPMVGTSFLVITAWVKDNPRLCWVQVVRLEVQRPQPIKPGKEFQDE